MAGQLADLAGKYPNKFGSNTFLKAWPYAPPALLSGFIMLLGFLAVFFFLEEVSLKIRYFTLIFTADDDALDRPSNLWKKDTIQESWLFAKSARFCSAKWPRTITGPLAQRLPRKKCPISSRKTWILLNKILEKNSSQSKLPKSQRYCLPSGCLPKICVSHFWRMQFRNITSPLITRCGRAFWVIRWMKKIRLGCLSCFLAVLEWNQIRLCGQCPSWE